MIDFLAILTSSCAVTSFALGLVTFGFFLTEKKTYLAIYATFWFAVGLGYGNGYLFIIRDHNLYLHLNFMFFLLAVPILIHAATMALRRPLPNVTLKIWHVLTAINILLVLLPWALDVMVFISYLYIGLSFILLGVWLSFGRGRTERLYSGALIMIGLMNAWFPWISDELLQWYGFLFSLITLWFALSSLLIYTKLKHLDYLTLRDKLERMSYEDPLTKTKNRAYFNEWLTKLHKEDTLYALIVTDLNELKTINDTLGHLAGDELIIKTAEKLQTFFGSDHVIRFGGDEFLVILEKTKRDIAQQKVAHFQQQLKASSSSEMPIELAMGVASRRTKEPFEKVFKRAEVRMYEAKNKRPS